MEVLLQVQVTFICKSAGLKEDLFLDSRFSFVKIIQLQWHPAITNTTPIGQDRETLTFKVLLYLNVAVDAQV